MFVCSYNVKIHASGFNKLLKSVFCLLLVVEVFSAKSCWDAWSSSNRLSRGQVKVNMVDEAKLPSPIRSISEVLVVQWTIRHCHKEEKWPLYFDQHQLLALQFSMHLIDLLSRLYRCNGFTGIQKVVVDQMGSRTPNSDHDLFLVPSLALGTTLEHLRNPTTELVVTNSHKIHFSSQVTIRLRNGSLLLRRIREGETSKWFFWFPVSSWVTHLLNFFTFSICFKCWLSIGWSTLSSSATSHVVVRGSALMSLSVGHCQLPIAGQYAPHLQGSRPLWKLAEATLHWKFISSFWAKCVVDVTSCLCCFMTHFELK